MGDYIKELLRPILASDISDDIVEYIINIKHEEDYDEFMENIVDLNNPEHVRIYETLKQEQFGPRNKKKRDTKQLRDTKEAFQTLSSIEQSQKLGKGKGKKKFVNFYGQNSQPGLKKGRCPCQCEATKHNLINNCRKCGRIVCEQEGSGPCFFCDEMVCTRYEMEILQAKNKESDKLYNHLMEQTRSKQWKKAIESRNKLLATDQMGDAIKTRILDDENDYFQTNSQWLNDEEKSSAKKKYLNHHNIMHKSKRDLKLALDFASRTVTIGGADGMKNKENMMKGVNKLLDSTERRFPKNLFMGEKGELMSEIVMMMDEHKITGNKNPVQKNEYNEALKIKRIANTDFLESVDQGLCLSMHQPWASLLVAGIKMHEGRTWKTDHRGRLWIAAAAKELDDDEILNYEAIYRALYNDDTLEFPKKYPTGCLLGCVTVEDCLKQDEYHKKYPNGESSSPYVFICTNPVILPIFYPMQGQHKIFPLPKELHRTAKAALMSSKWV